MMKNGDAWLKHSLDNIDSNKAASKFTIDHVKGNQYECSAVCPKLISHDFISKLNRDFVAASLRKSFKSKPSTMVAG